MKDVSSYSFSTNLRTACTFHSCSHIHTIVEALICIRIECSTYELQLTFEFIIPPIVLISKTSSLVVYFLYHLRQNVPAYAINAFCVRPVAVWSVNKLMYCRARSYLKFIYLFCSFTKGFSIYFGSLLLFYFRMGTKQMCTNQLIIFKLKLFFNTL